MVINTKVFILSIVRGGGLLLSPFWGVVRGVGVETGLGEHVIVPNTTVVGEFGGEVRRGRSGGRGEGGCGWHQGHHLSYLLLQIDDLLILLEQKT